MTSDAPVLAALNSLAALATIWLAVMGAGCPLARRLQIPAGDPLAHAVWTAGLGLATIGWIFALVGWAGLLYQDAIGISTLLAAVWGLIELARIAFQRRRSRLENRHKRLEPRTGALATPGASGRPTTSRSSADVALVMVAAISTLAMLVCASAPTTSREVISGSLAIAKEISLAHSLAYSPSGDPTLATVWFQWALALDGPITAGLLQWSLGLLAAGAVALLARRLFGNDVGWTAAALFLLAPGAQYQLAVPADDLPAAASAVLALVAWRQTLTGQRVACWSVVAGFMLGTALAIEAVSIGIALGIGFATAWRAGHDFEYRQQWLRSLSIMAAFACLLGACWHVRAGPQAAAVGGLGLEREAIVSLGVLLIGLAPAAILMRPRGAVRQVAIFAAIVSATGAILFPQQRWWLLACPLCVALAAHTWQLVAGFPRLPRRIAQAAILGLALLALRGPLAAAGAQGRVAFGLESREAYLLRQHPEFAAVVVANSLVPPDGRLLADDRFCAYLRCRTTSAADSWQILRQQLRPEEQARRLRTSGITHVLLAQPDAEARLAIAADDFPSSKAAATKPVLPLAEFRLTRQDASIWRYSLLQVR